ncbi:MAG: hypothetical protein NTV05_01380 [Acidobacteria bacterium]|nr:hypothetical protein [Acidobacteriota bacterium]
MERRCWTVVLFAMAILVAGSGGSAPLRARTAVAPQGPGQQPPSFTSTTVLVPVDVRVVDRKSGKAVTDLQQDDFTLLEDGMDLTHAANDALVVYDYRADLIGSADRSVT